MLWCQVLRQLRDGFCNPLSFNAITEAPHPTRLPFGRGLTAAHAAENLLGLLTALE